jgi:hypothetical protein
MDENVSQNYRENLPLKFVKISAPRQTTMDDERRAIWAQHMQLIRQTKVKEEKE